MGMTLQGAILESARTGQAFRRAAWLRSKDPSVFRASVDGTEEGFTIEDELRWKRPGMHWESDGIAMLSVSCILAEDWEMTGAHE